MCYFPCKSSETSYTACEANWDQGLLKGGDTNFLQMNKGGPFFSDHAEHFIKHRYKEPKRNLLNFGFHLEFDFITALQLMTYFCVISFGIFQQTRALLSSRKGNKNIWKPKQVIQRKANAGWEHEFAHSLTEMHFSSSIGYNQWAVLADEKHSLFKSE